MKKRSGQSISLFQEKQVLRGGLLRDGMIWKLPPSDRYPDGVRYRLALVDIETGRILALFDNHHPKGHHRHWEDRSETPYSFESVEKLVKDYLDAVRQEEKRRESKKN